MKIETKDLKEDIKEARPNLKDNTIKQYETNLEKLKKLFDTDTYDFLSKPNEVMEKIADKHYLSQRNFLNAIVVLLMALNSEEKYDKLIEEYGKIRDKFNDQYTESNNSGIISDKQSKNFATLEEVYEMLNKMGEDLKPIKKKNKEDITKKEMQLLQAYVLCFIHSRMPFRNETSTTIAIQKRNFSKLSKEEQEAKNYLLVEKNGLSWIMNQYKTSKKYAQKILPIEDPELKKILRFYLRINGMGVLFKTSTGKPITKIELSKILLKYSQRYMNKNISSTMLRKIYLSSKYGDMKKELEKDNNVMGHSKATALNNYVKEAQED